MPVATQVQQYLAKGPVDANALLLDQRLAATTSSISSVSLAAGAATPAQVQAALGTAAVELASRRPILKAAGARNVIIWYVPDVGTTLEMGSQPGRARP